jgi:hypothetical protein
MISKSELRTIAQHRDDYCVSIYLPTYRVGRHFEENPIRLKNMLDEAEAQLKEAGMEPAEVTALLQGSRDVVEDEVFWQNQRDGFALYLSESFNNYYRLRHCFEPQVVVTDRFHIKPLFPLLNRGREFYVIALSQGGVQLFEGTRFGIDEVETEDLPDSVVELLDYEELERHLQFHSRTATPADATGVTPPGASSAQPGAVSGDLPGGMQMERPGMFHGQSVAEEDDRQDVRKYFQRVDAALAPFLRDGGRPLVLAGVDYLLPLYREVNSYQNLVEEGITGSPNTLSVEDIHERAWELVEPQFTAEREEAIRLYEQLAGMEKDVASHNFEEIVPSAYFEKVDTIFVARNTHVWGIFDPESAEVEVHDEETGENEDLLDLAVLHTYLNSGTVYVLDPEDVPGGPPVAAMFRY